jgi:hypothetical protein
MVDLVRVGAVPGNRSGTGARGYRILRKGKVVAVWWGGIEVRKKGSKTYYCWSAGWPRKRVYSQSSIQAAILYRDAKVKKHCGIRLKYEKLPSGVRISA